MEDRDRHDCYRPPAPSPVGGQIISAWLCMSPCRSDHIFTTVSGSVRHMVSEDSGSDVRIQPFLLIARTDRIVTAHRHSLRRGCDSKGEYRRILGVSSK